MKYLLIDSEYNKLREEEFVDKPADPVGKGWRWIDPNDYDTLKLAESSKKPSSAPKKKSSKKTKQ